MRRRFYRPSFFPGGISNLTVLKSITCLLPAAFVFLIEVLRHTFFGQTGPVLQGDLAVFAIVLVGSFVFSKIAFALLDKTREDSEHRIRELSTINEIYQSINEIQDLNALLARVMDKLIEVTVADSGDLYLIDELSHQLAHSLHGGPKESALKPEVQQQLREGLINFVMRSNEPIVIEDMKDAKNRHLAFLLQAGIRSVALVPLSARSGVIGVVALYSRYRRHFQAKELNLLMHIGSQIASAAENARLYEKVQAVAVLEERERISKELHDGLAQVLGYVITKSQATRQLLRKMTMANDYLVELENVAQDVYTDTREAILGLKTAISGDRNIVSALREYSTRFTQMHGIKTKLEVDDRIIPALSPQVEVQAIRVVQEALCNVRKHAQASHAIIRVTSVDGVVTIVVEDDGKGFDVSKVNNSDWTKCGLRNIKERAESIHSVLNVESGPENGTRITLSIPSTPEFTPAEEGR
jgi:signal transduction histidine kinase